VVDNGATATRSPRHVHGGEKSAAGCVVLHLADIRTSATQQTFSVTSQWAHHSRTRPLMESCVRNGGFKGNRGRGEEQAWRGEGGYVGRKYRT
jgi:hypothetical protein